VVQGFRPRGKKTEGKGGKNPSVNTKNVAIWRQKKTTDSPYRTTLHGKGYTSIFKTPARKRDFRYIRDTVGI
jgi:hypothetical protein